MASRRQPLRICSTTFPSQVNFMTTPECCASAFCMSTAQIYCQTTCMRLRRYVMSMHYSWSCIERLGMSCGFMQSPTVIFATQTRQVKHDVHGHFILLNDLAPEVHMHCAHLCKQLDHSALVITEPSAISAHGKSFGLAGSSFQVSNMLGLPPLEALLLWQASCRASISMGAKYPAWSLQQQSVQGSC